MRFAPIRCSRGAGASQSTIDASNSGGFFSRASLQPISSTVASFDAGHARAPHLGVLHLSSRSQAFQKMADE
jgi:hypothetical protein